MLNIILISVTILLFIIVAIFGITFFWQNRSSQQLKKISGSLRLLQSVIKQKFDSIKEYNIDDEPYASIIKGLLENLETNESNTRELLIHYGEIQTDLRSRSNLTWTAIPRLPLDMYRIHTRVKKIQSDYDNVLNSISKFDRQYGELKRLGWKIASIARKSLENIQTGLHNLLDLKDKGIQGDTIDRSIVEAKQIEERLYKDIPVMMLTDTEEEILTKADKNIIITVHSLITDIDSDVHKLLKQSQEWEAIWGKLDGTLGSLIADFRHLTGQFEELETSKVYPLAWDKSRESLFELRQQVERLGTIQKARSLEQLEGDLRIASKLNIQLLELSRQCQEVEQQHAELLALLSSQDIQEGTGWGRDANKLAQQIQSYAPENWDNKLVVHQLREDLRTLISFHKNPSWQSPATLIKETELPEILKEVQELSKLHLDLRPRVAAISARLGEIQNLERQTKDNLGRCKALLNQGISLAGSNPIMSEAISELEQIRSTIDPLLDELNNPNYGILDKKAQKAIALINRAEQSTNHWLMLLNVDLHTKQEILRTKVTKLQEIGTLEDPAILEGQRIVETIPVKRTAEAETTKGALSIAKSIKDKLTRSGEGPVETLPMSEGIKEIKLSSEDWQRYVIIIKTIEDLEGPVLEMSAKLEQSRANSQQLLNRASEVMPEMRSWPPVNQSLGGERGQFAALERKYLNLKKEPLKAIQIVTRISSISDEYQQLANKARLVIENAEKDQSRILEQETRLEEVKGLWKELRNANPGNAFLKDDIQILLQSADQQMEAIKEKYKLGGLTYNQTLQNIRALYQNLSSAVVTYDNETIIDINGEIANRE